jgi:outer membrane biosynthesis protein TonB
MGCQGDLNLRNPAHQRFVIDTLRSGLTGKDLFWRMAQKMECDILHDNPDLMHAARLIIWLAWNDKMTFQDMRWFKPCLELAKVVDWDYYAECYGGASAYGRCLAAALMPAATKSAAKKLAAKKPAAKKPAAKKPAAKKPAAKQPAKKPAAKQPAKQPAKKPAAKKPAAKKPAAKKPATPIKKKPAQRPAAERRAR